jgi:hypothetical protein
VRGHLRGVAAGPEHDPVAELDDEPGLFGDGNKFRRRDGTPCRMAPTCQRFDGHHASRYDVDHRLVVDLQLITPDRFAQIDFQRAPSVGFRLHLHRINLEAIAPLAFRSVEGKVGVAQDLVDPLAMRGDQGDPDAAADDDRATVDFIRLADRLDQPSC